MSRIPVPNGGLQSAPGSPSMPSTPASEPRRKTNRRDESLRKKIENELSRKRPGGGRGQQDGTPSSFKRPSKRNIKGTVAGLRPSPALTVPEGMSVADAAQLCAAKRTDCVLVVDEEEGLSGIFTAKDLAFRVTAEGLDPRLTAVSTIMTRNPMVTRDTTSATEALQLMVSRHFRHLPVCNEDGDVVGLLDITKVFHDALAKVERSSSATNQLSAALAGVQSELGPGLNSNPQAAAMLAYVDALRDKMAQPDLMSVLDTSLPPPTVTPRTSVREAARLMKDRRTTAVCVLEANSATSTLSGMSNPGAPPKIAGIFTSKDIVLRVIAAGLDASRCSVVRVMTPHPDTAPPFMIVQDALKKMHNGHYLNLPVVTEDEGRLIGIVDVLKLTYATLEQIDSMNEETGSESGGPMWSKFFDTLNQGAPEDDSVSALSRHSSHDTPSKLHQRGLSVTSPISEVMPGDSASAINDNISDIGLNKGPASSVAPPALPEDDGTYVFKFKTPSGRTHRFQARHDSYDLLRDIVLGKLQVDPFFEPSSDSNAFVPDPTCFVLSYNDDEGDLVDITADTDVADAVSVARGQKSSRVVLSVHGGKNWEEAIRLNAASAAAEAEEAAEEAKVVSVPEKKIETIPELPEVSVSVSDPAETLKDPRADPAHEPTYGATGVHARNIVDPNDLILGVLPKDMALPAAIGFLGVVIAGVFVASRTTK
ncbi:hypothetical protein CcaverHIS631_0509220 [Cutaneotrichosporon cavernicola]|nr:hypothetical protein CcaverHIS631_0509220 [Cutaneotrichosporon cavernicola]BEJ08832.1 hypothetical protein CcaverHIS641_0509260 [Cutaneotrichosporon cavernicola]